MHTCRGQAAYHMTKPRIKGSQFAQKVIGVIRKEIFPPFDRRLGHTVVLALTNYPTPNGPDAVFGFIIGENKMLNLGMSFQKYG